MSEMPSGLKVRFLCDPNLGRLAKWLRIMGFDTQYMHDWNERMIAKALSEDRIILTRKQKMLSKKNVLFIKSDHTRDQLIQLNKIFDLLPKTQWFTRCNVCNEPLLCVNPDDVKGLVPEYVFTTQKMFAKCPKCLRIYWKGTHPEKSRKTINNLLTPREEK